MIKLNKTRMIFFILAMIAVKAYGQVPYSEMLKAITQDKSNIVSEIPEITALNKAQTMEQARLVLAGKSYLNIKNTEKTSGVSGNDLQSLVSNRQITFVIVPGVLGEFIDTRAFEELFARDSIYKRQWQAIADKTGAVDQRFDLSKNTYRNEKLSNLINAASIDSGGRALIKVIILRTQLGSLESVGTNEAQAKVFNRRLQKYFDLTGDKNIVLVGYSRGTPLALEMITQAQAKGFTYFRNVQAIVSYAGVVMGSALADVTGDLNTESGRLLAAAKKYQNDLQYSEGILDRPFKSSQNAAALATFVKALADNSKFDADMFLANTRSGDFKTVAALIVKMSAELGLGSLYDFNGHVDRVKVFISEVIKAVEGLKTSSMQTWWKTHTLPRHIQYLSLAAAMVDPEKNALEKSIFNSKEGYSDSLDDKSLLENKRVYEKLTGVALNDSQVAVYQSLFLPNVISTLNSQNSNLTIKSLGLLHTHHWGVSLQVVNKMKDGRTNPFPREAVLLSLAAYLNQ